MLGGASFWFGDDSGDIGPYAGVDFGYTMCGCFGIDVFYRYVGGTFDRIEPSGILEDSGAFHHVGLKFTYQSSFSQGSRWYWWGGLGASWFKAREFRDKDDGIAGYGELGLGFLVTDSIRARLGVSAHAADTVIGRKLPSVDTGSRLLWTVAPTLGVEFDL